MTASKKYLRDKADKLVGDYVKARDGYECQLVGFNDKPCGGPLAWCHLIPKGRYGSVRWSPLNSVTGCRNHHMAFDTSPLEKNLWCEQRLGTAVWEHLQLVARTTDRPNPRDVIAAYQEV